jgi:hypothetical protein
MGARVQMMPDHFPQNFHYFNGIFQMDSRMLGFLGAASGFDQLTQLPPQAFCSQVVRRGLVYHSTVLGPQRFYDAIQGFRQIFILEITTCASFEGNGHLQVGHDIFKNIRHPPPSFHGDRIQRLRVQGLLLFHFADSPDLQVLAAFRTFDFKHPFFPATLRAYGGFFGGAKPSPLALSAQGTFHKAGNLLIHTPGISGLQFIPYGIAGGASYQFWRP